MAKEKRKNWTPRRGNGRGGANQQGSGAPSPKGELSPEAKAAKKQAETMEIDNQVAFIEGTADKHATKPPPGILKTPPKERHGVNFDESRNIETPPNRLRVRLDKEVERRFFRWLGTSGRPADIQGYSINDDAEKLGSYHRDANRIDSFIRRSLKLKGDDVIEINQIQSIITDCKRSQPVYYDSKEKQTWKEHVRIFMRVCRTRPDQVYEGGYSDEDNTMNRNFYARLYAACVDSLGPA
jgi:hypothetical protein